MTSPSGISPAAAGQRGPVDRLDAVLDLAWSALAGGASGEQPGFRTAVLATAGAAGAPQARTIILRAADRAARSLRFHTDRRSSKILEIRQNPLVSLVFYDRSANLQIRVAGTAHLHEGDALARAAWNESALTSRRIHLTEPGPGAGLAAPASGLPPGLDTRPPTEAEAEAGFAHFVAVVVLLHEIDVYQLHPAGHRRSTHEWDRAGVESARWRVP